MERDQIESIHQEVQAALDDGRILGGLAVVLKPARVVEQGELPCGGNAVQDFASWERILSGRGAIGPMIRLGPVDVPTSALLEFASGPWLDLLAREFYGVQRRPRRARTAIGSGVVRW